MSNSPAFQFYPREWLSDFEIRALSDTQKGFFMDLMCHCWEVDGLPNDTKKMAAAMQRSHSSFLKLWSSGVSSLFTESSNKLTLKMLEREKVKQAARSEKAKSSATKRWDKSDSCERSANAVPTHCEGNAIIEAAIANEDAKEETGGSAEGGKKPSRKVSTPKYDAVGFETFWEVYPGGGTRAEAVTEWDKLRPDKELQFTIAQDIPYRLQNDRDWADGYIKHACRYLKYRLWESKVKPRVVAHQPTLGPYQTDSYGELT
jgi:uncharacterized protein YdaU (DUF1376 family)